jgi:hypothetical protein
MTSHAEDAGPNPHGADAEPPTAYEFTIPLSPVSANHSIDCYLAF